MTSTELQQTIKRRAGIELARRDLFWYCNLMAPDFYKESHTYLVDMCRDLMDFLSSDDNVLVMNVPPRHGKSRTATLFVEWLLGQDHSKKIMTASYNDTVSTVFSKAVRDTIQAEKGDEDKVVYSDVFPDTKIQYGDAKMNLWSLVGGYNNYLATSPGGTATGFGADIMVIDDLIKNQKEANNAFTLASQWQWFNDTMLSRLEKGGKIVIIMTRWHSQDLAGRAMEEMPKAGYKMRHINLKALQDDGTMLCDDILDREDYERKKATMSPEIAAANYQQEPIDSKGQLYTGFKLYDPSAHPAFRMIASYTDTADTGADNFASYVFGVSAEGEAYILDTLYSKEAMQVTEPATATMFIRNQVNTALIESNNGGTGFARNVQTELAKRGWNRTVVKWFHQSANKDSRILSNSSWVMEHIYFPADWGQRWPRLYKDLTTYQREGKNEHDDAPDALTGVAELLTGQRQAAFENKPRQQLF